ncbi:MAG: MoaD/ThiS family protein [Thermoplasmataceae archaeon]
MKLRVKLFGSVRDDVGADFIEVDVPGQTSAQDLVSNLKRKYDALSIRKGPLLVAVNQKLAEPNTPIRDNDEIAIFPMVSGG